VEMVKNVMKVEMVKNVMKVELLMVALMQRDKCQVVTTPQSKKMCYHKAAPLLAL
jgi:hypothetical protein